MTEPTHHDPGADGLARAAQTAAMSLAVIEALARLQRDRAAHRGINGAGSPTPAERETDRTREQGPVRPLEAIPHDVPDHTDPASAASVNAAAATASVTPQSLDAVQRVRPTANGADLSLGRAGRALPVPHRLVPARPTHHSASRRR